MYYFFLFFFFFACTNTSKNLDSDLDCWKQKQILEELLTEKQLTINVLSDFYQSVSKDLDELIQENPALLVEAPSSDTLQNEWKSLAARLKSDLEDLQKLSASDHSPRALKERLGIRAKQMEKIQSIFHQMHEKVNEQKSEIENLEQELSGVNAAYLDIFENYLEQEKSNPKVYYYCAGSAENLVKNQIIQKNQALWKVFELTPQKLEQYCEVWENQNNFLEIKAKKIQILTTHQKNTYIVSQKKADIWQFQIKNPSVFWENQPYFIVLIENN